MRRLLINRHNQGSFMAPCHAAAHCHGVHSGCGYSTDTNADTDTGSNDLRPCSCSTCGTLRSMDQGVAKAIHLSKLHLPSSNIANGGRCDGSTSRTRNPGDSGVTIQADVNNATIAERADDPHVLTRNILRLIAAPSKEGWAKIVVESCEGDGVLEVLAAASLRCEELVWSNQVVESISTRMSARSRHHAHLNAGKMTSPPIARSLPPVNRAQLGSTLRAVQLELLDFRGALDSFLYFINTFCAGNALEEFELVDCHLPSTCSASMLGNQLLRQTSLRSLTVNDCDFGSVGTTHHQNRHDQNDGGLWKLLQPILESPSLPCQLRTLSLDGQTCSLQTARHLRKYLSHSGCVLTTLSLSGCFSHLPTTPPQAHTPTSAGSQPQESIVQEIALALRGNASLRTLTMATNHLGDSCLVMLMRDGLGRRRNRTLQRLDFQGNNVTDGALREMVSPRNPSEGRSSSILAGLSLSHLTLHSNHLLTPTGMMETLVESMRNYSQLSLFKVETPRFSASKRTSKELTEVQHMLNHYGNLDRGGRALLLHIHAGPVHETVRRGDASADAAHDGGKGEASVPWHLVLGQVNSVQSRVEEASGRSLDVQGSAQAKTCAINVMYEFCRNGLLQSR